VKASTTSLDAFPAPADIEREREERRRRREATANEDLADTIARTCATVFGGRGNIPLEALRKIGQIRRGGR
jgi:hypothetical protein